MSNKSNRNGRAYEFACLTALYQAIQKYRTIQVLENSSYTLAKKAWGEESEDTKHLYTLSAQSIIPTIFAMEPHITAQTDDILHIYIQKDFHGEVADVRDIILKQENIVWEIGFSVKHNHLAVKHSRLAKNLDFGKKWYGIACSQNYWDAIRPVFNYLEDEKHKGTLFQNLLEKDSLYCTVLMAFIDEINLQLQKNNMATTRLIQYLLSKYDFYKVISHDAIRVTTVQAFNMYGTLNRATTRIKPSIKVPKIPLPQHILFCGLKSGSKTTAILAFDNGWQFSFRVHNANKAVEPSLKFDIRLEGIPAELNIKHHCSW